MRHPFKHARRAGLPPGTIQFVGEQKVERVRLRVISYGPEHLEERELESVEDCLRYRDDPHLSWINIDGLHDAQTLQTLGGHYGIHPLVLEDIAHTTQRPKLEDHQDYLFLVLKLLRYEESEERVFSEQLSLILGRGYVVSFQERVGDVFEPVRERIRGGRGRIRALGPDYLAYALMDAVVDNYFIILEKAGDQVETLEDDLLLDPTPELLHSVHAMKREMIQLRRAVWPLREAVGGIERCESPLIKKGTRVFLRDLYDHTIQVAEGVDNLREVLSGFQDLYLSSISNRMNEVMKVLTIIATIFVPLTFAAGIYGMNFDFMPELHWKWAYGVFWIVILFIAGVMLLFFRRKRWL
jgi:magnesium transporter